MTTPFRTIVLSTPLLLAGCIVDLGGLSEPGSGAGGTSTGDGGGTTAGAGGGAACSPLSCGACEEPCPEGGCPASVVANGPGVADTPLGLAVGPGALYWVNQGSGTVLRVRDDGSGPEILTTADSPRTIAAGSDLLVWSAKDGVWACPPDACEAGKKLLAPSIAPDSVREVALDGAFVYWTDRGSSQDAKDGVVRRCDPSDCQPLTIADLLWAPTGLALLGDDLLWTTQADAYENGYVEKGQKAMMGSQEIIAGQVQPTGLAADDLRVYWTEYTQNGRVRTCLHGQYCAASDEVAKAAGPLAFPRDVALAGSRVYFSTTDADGAIRSCPSPRCGDAEAPRLHTSGRPTLHRMAVGATCVFFTDESNGGSVMKVAR